MKIRQFLSVVPKPVKTAAAILFVCAVIGGVVVGYLQGWSSCSMHVGGAPPLTGAMVGFVVGLLGGGFTAIWLICLGYVYADARRRAMPPVLWTLAAILFPNLLGFLLYYLLRRPLGLPCTHCGQPISTEQRFCPWCGAAGPATPPTAPLSVDDGAPGAV
jgi:hypothetical protein